MTADYHFKYSDKLDIGWVSDGFHISKYCIDGVYHADVITIPVEEIPDFIKNGDISGDFAQRLICVAEYSREQLHQYYEEEKVRQAEQEKQFTIERYHKKCDTFKLHDYICAYCGADLAKTGHVDRIVPGKKGGKYEISNTVLACQSCNSRKGGRTPEEANMEIRYGSSNLRKGYSHGQ